MPDMIVSKTCTKCKASKSLTEFHKDKSRLDGYRSHCKECYKAYLTGDTGNAARKVTQEAYRATEVGKVAQRRCVAKNAERYPEKIKARQAVSNAIRNGKLPKASTLNCPCKEPAKEYHHYLGYTPEHRFDVIALCIKCHLNCIRIT